MKTILVTGATGYIGSHTCVSLLEAGFDVVGIDNLTNSTDASLARVAQLTGKPVGFVTADVRDAAALDAVFARQRIDAVIHFAGLKAVGESVAEPLRYIDNNVVGSLRLVEAMARAGVYWLVFSSSATVYSVVGSPCYTESSPLGPSNPYGQSKLTVEHMLRDLAISDSRWRIALLRYFNPVGAHPSGVIGENPNGIPTNLMPFITQVAVGKRAELAVFGGDYPTTDGTGVRDYIHVMDLADGHLATLRQIDSLPNAAMPINLGSGRGHSVLEVVETFRRASGVPVPYRVVERRPGDIPAYWADATLAAELLGWKTRRSLEEMCADAWRWQRNNPDGFADKSS